MKKSLSMLLVFITMTAAALAVPCPYRIQASAGSGTVSTNSSGGGTWCNATTTLVVCEDESLNLRYHPSDAAAVFGTNGYQFHSFTAVNIYTSATHAFGLYLNNMWQGVSLPVGTYTVTGSYTNNNGTYQSAEITVRVIAVNVPAPTLSAGPYCVNSAITVVGTQTFTNSAEYSAEVIDMGDGTVITPNTYGGPWYDPWEQINTTHTYSAPGTYNVTLKRTYPCGVRTETTTIQVGPTPAFSFSEPICEDSPTSFTLTSTCQGAIDPGTIQWTFGDGNSSTATNPTHTYTSSGSFFVTLSFEVNGQSYFTTQGVTVAAAPLANLGPDQSFCPNGLFSWPTLYADNIYESYSWSFNGSVLRGQTGESLETFDFGVYCVTVTNGNGCTATDCMEITEKPVLAPLDPNYDIDLSSSGCNYYMDVYPNDTRSGVFHQWYIYKNQPAGTTNGGTLDATYYGTSWSGSPQLPYTFAGGTWYWIKHGVYAECDAWTEKRQAYYWSCKTGEAISFSEDEVNTVTMYPNPADQVVHITGLGGSVVVNIYSTDGRLVQSQSMNQANGLPMAVDVAALDAGIYIVQAKDAFGKSINERLIVE